MDDLPYETVGKVFNTLSGEKRVKSFYLLFGETTSPKSVAEELEITRQGVQRYITSWKQAGLIESHGNDYVLTGEGEIALELVEEALNQF